MARWFVILCSSAFRPLRKLKGMGSLYVVARPSGVPGSYALTGAVAIVT